MDIKIEISETAVKQLILDDLSNKLNMPIQIEDIKIEVKSKQNWKAEWETAYFRATLNTTVK